MFLSMYISTVWRTRKENLRIGIFEKYFIKRVMENIELWKIARQNLEKIYGQYINRLSYEELNKMI